MDNQTDFLYVLNFQNDVQHRTFASCSILSCLTLSYITLFRPESLLLVLFTSYYLFIYLFSIFPSCTNLSLSHNSFTCVCVCVSCCNKSLVSSISPFIIFRYDYTVNRIRCLDAAKSGLILLNCSYR